MKTAEWTAALRSGNYPQGQRRLINGGAFCCLGVLCAVKGLEKKIQYGETMYIFGEGQYSHAVIPGPFRSTMLEDLDLSMQINQGDANQDCLAGVLMSMNDNGKSFSEIADYIDSVAGA